MTQPLIPSLDANAAVELVSPDSPALAKAVACASGGVLWRIRDDVKEVCVIHRSRYGDEWNLPKGHLDPGESWQEAAVREVLEETCCRGRIVALAGATSYMVHGAAKVVIYWSMELMEERAFEVNHEVDAVEWLVPPEALARLSHGAERGMVANVFPETKDLG